MHIIPRVSSFFFFQAEDGIRDVAVTGVQTCALPILAGTVVVRDRPENLQLASVAADRGAEPEALEAGPPELADEEFRLLDQLLERLQGLEGAVRQRLTAELVARFAPRFPRREVGRAHV